MCKTFANLRSLGPENKAAIKKYKKTLAKYNMVARLRWAGAHNKYVMDDKRTKLNCLRMSMHETNDSTAQRR